MMKQQVTFWDDQKRNQTDNKNEIKRAAVEAARRQYHSGPEQIDCIKIDFSNFRNGLMFFDCTCAIEGWAGFFNVSVGVHWAVTGIAESDVIGQRNWPLDVTETTL